MPTIQSVIILFSGIAILILAIIAASHRNKRRSVERTISILKEMLEKAPSVYRIDRLIGNMKIAEIKEVEKELSKLYNGFLEKDYTGFIADDIIMCIGKIYEIKNVQKKEYLTGIFRQCINEMPGPKRGKTTAMILKESVISGAALNVRAKDFFISASTKISVDSQNHKEYIAEFNKTIERLLSEEVASEEHATLLKAEVIKLKRLYD